MPFRSRFSSKRKGVRLLEQRLSEAGLNVKRKEVYFDGEPAYYLEIQGNHSTATLKPAIAHQEFPESPELTLQLADADSDREIHDIIREEYNRSMPYFRNLDIAAGIALVYSIACCVGMFFVHDDYRLALGMSAVPVWLGGLVIGLISDERRFDRNNRPWSSDELDMPYPVSTKKPYDNLNLLKAP